MTPETVFIVDDDADVRDSLRALLESARFNVVDFDSARAFLTAPRAHGGCMIADIRMPDMDGLELQEELTRQNVGLPVIIVTGHGDVPLAVRAMKAGAVDFIEKPYDDELLLESVRRALDAGQQQNRQTSTADPVRAGLVASLTLREREVLEHLIAGQPNKVVAFELGISPRTVEIHRAHLMEKMQARSLPELVRTALAAGVVPSGEA
ncbi:MAG: response regulator FixJ [Parvibaculum sp.]|uniref:response regulator FixJ n=1 Tax=Parvibaculum sp. TaxID=2024848 RepID=UPI003C750BC1